MFLSKWGMVVEVVYPDVGSIFTDAELCARSSEAHGKVKPSTVKRLPVKGEG